jgi:hypothetical protein
VRALARTPHIHLSFEHVGPADRVQAPGRKTTEDAPAAHAQPNPVKKTAPKGLTPNEAESLCSDE